MSDPPSPQRDRRRRKEPETDKESRTLGTPTARVYENLSTIRGLDLSAFLGLPARAPHQESSESSESFEAPKQDGIMPPVDDTPAQTNPPIDDPSTQTPDVGKAITHDAAQDVSPDGDRVGQLMRDPLEGEEVNFGMDRQKPSESSWVQALIDINDRILPGFANETIQRVGLGPYKGLHVRVKLEMGLYVKPTIKVQFVIRHLSKAHSFAVMIIPLQSVLAKPFIVDIESTDERSLLPLLAHQQMNLEELGRSTTIPDPFPSITSGNEGRPALDISQEIKTIRTLRVDIASNEIIISKSQSFHQERPNHPQALCDIADAVLECLEFEPSSLVSIRTWFFAETTFVDAWWQALENIGAYTRPYAEMLTKVRKNGYTDLSFGNFVLDELEHPKKPVPAVSMFIDGEQQTVSIMGGVIEEIVMQDELAANLWDTNLKAVAIKDPYSVWEPQENDIEVYGIPADRQPLRWYFVVDLSNGIADMFPDVDVPFYAYLRVPYNARPLPSTGFSAEQLTHIRLEVIHNLLLAEHKGLMAERYVQAQLDKAVAKEDATKEESLREKLATCREKAYANFAACFLFSLIPVPSHDAVRDHPKKPLNVQLAATANHLADVLRQQDSESDIDWGERICAWVRDNARGSPQQTVSGYGESFRIIRRQLLPGTSGDIALCEVLTATQSNWPIGMKKPPIKLDLPRVTIKGPANQFMANIWQGAKDEPAKTVYPTVTFKAWYQPDVTSLKSECAAITCLNSQADAGAKRFWNYTQRFGESKDLHNWLAQYPALGRQVSEHHYTGERHDVLSRLDKVPFGYAAITGGPGSGKSTLAEDIVLAVISEPCSNAVVTQVPTPPEQPNNPQDGPEDGSQVGNQNTWVIHDGNQDVKKDSNQDVDQNQFINLNQEQGQEVWAGFNPVGAQLPESWDTESVDMPAGQDNRLSPTAAWIVADNQLCDDAQVRLSTKAPGVLILRARPWKTEMDNMFSPSSREPNLISTNERPHATPQDQRLAEHINHQIRTRFEQKSPSHGPMTVSEYAKHIAQENPDDWANYLRAYHQKLTDPEAFCLSRAENEQYARDLLGYVLAQVKIICCTPVTLEQLVNHSQTQLDFIVLDEASRMTEAMSAIPMSKCPQASFLLVGDVRQFGPVVTTIDRKDWKSFFGPQRATSLFKRMENSGAMLYRLKSNYRAHGHAADFVRVKFYESQMTIINKMATPATTGITSYLASKTKSQYPNIMIDVPEATEIKVGTSYTNPATAHLAVSLAIQMYRECTILNAKDAKALQQGDEVNVRRGTILIVTPYLSQKNDISFLLSQVTEAELPPGLVEVRTAESSLSHSASVVIVDLVRTGRRGFTDHADRVAVMLSRAELATITIAHVHSINENSRLGSYVAFLKERGAVYSLGKKKSRPQWTEWCSRCLQPGHQAHSCRQVPQCTTCNERHATRYCPRVHDNAISEFANEPVTADDGVVRDAFLSSGIGKQEGKRVAFRGENRASRKPPANMRSQAKADFMEACKALRPADVDDNEGEYRRQ